LSNRTNKIVNILFGTLIIILILIILYLMFFRDEEVNLKPSGNIDIFDINCNYNCDCDDNENVESVFGENDFKDNFNIEDNKGLVWNSTNDLNIFANPMYEMKEKIAPESTNFYQFVVRNNTIYNVNYNIDFSEKNDMNINMKYRLIKNEQYIAGNEEKWVDYNELDLKQIYIKSKSSDTYYLEWKWFSSDNDTLIGESGNVSYSLKIDIKAEQDLWKY